MARFISGGSMANIVDGIQHNLEVVTASYWIHAITRVFQFIPLELVAAVNEFAMTGSREMMDNIGVIAGHLKNSSPVKSLQVKFFKNDAGDGQMTTTTTTTTTSSDRRKGKAKK